MAELNPFESKVEEAVELMDKAGKEIEALRRALLGMIGLCEIICHRMNDEELRADIRKNFRYLRALELLKIEDYLL